jgi:hypothetical protein
MLHNEYKNLNINTCEFVVEAIENSFPQFKVHNIIPVVLKSNSIDGNTYGTHAIGHQNLNVSKKIYVGYYTKETFRVTNSGTVVSPSPVYPSEFWHATANDANGVNDAPMLDFRVIIHQATYGYTWASQIVSNAPFSFVGFEVSLDTVSPVMSQPSAGILFDPLCAERFYSMSYYTSGSVLVQLHFLITKEVCTSASVYSGTAWVNSTSNVNFGTFNLFIFRDILTPLAKLDVKLIYGAKERVYKSLPFSMGNANMAGFNYNDLANGFTGQTINARFDGTNVTFQVLTPCGGSGTSPNTSLPAPVTPALIPPSGVTQVNISLGNSLSNFDNIGAIAYIDNLTGNFETGKKLASDSGMVTLYNYLYAADANGRIWELNGGVLGNNTGLSI